LCKLKRVNPKGNAKSGKNLVHMKILGTKLGTTWGQHGDHRGPWGPLWGPYQLINYLNLFINKFNSH